MKKNGEQKGFEQANRRNGRGKEKKIQNPFFEVARAEAEGKRP